MRNFSDAERQLLWRLESMRVRYLVAGSWALGLHAIPLEPGDFDLLIGLDRSNVKAALAVAEELDPLKLRRTLIGDPLPGQQYRIALGFSHVDLLTSMPAVDLDDAWARRVNIIHCGFMLDVLSSFDLEKTLHASNRPRDREQLQRLHDRHRASSAGGDPHAEGHHLNLPSRE